MPRTKNLSQEDIAILGTAKRKMEDVGWAMKSLNKMGNIIDSKLALLPQKQQSWLQQLSYKVLRTVVKSNLTTMKDRKAEPWNKTYKALVTTSGAVGGAFGATAFAVDLTLTTKLMMRSIMDIARNHGEDLNSLDTQLACLQVFALGGKSKHDDSLDTGYYASRVAVQSAVKGGTSAASKALEGVLAGAAQPLLQAISIIAARFSIQVSEKFVAQAIPIIGAAGGASINLAFMQHFQQMAEAHFSIRALERKYGPELIKAQYESL